MNHFQDSGASQEPREEEINLRELFFRYLSHWPWFILSLAALLLAAAFYLRRTPAVYESYATMLFREDKGNLDMEGLLMQQMGMQGANKNIENEIEILKSRTLVWDALHKLDLHTRYYVQGRVRTVELFGDTPIKVVLDSLPSRPAEFAVEILSDTGFRLTSENPEIEETGTFGQPLSLPWGNTMVYRNLNSRDGIRTLVKIAPMETRVSQFQGILDLAPTTRTSSVVRLSLQTENPRLGRTLLDTLMHGYNEDWLNDRTQLNRNTLRFLDERLAFLSGNLENVERSVEAYLRSNQVANIEESATMALGQSSANEQRLVETETQIQLLRALEEDITRHADTHSLIPLSTLGGLMDATLQSLINQYNAFYLDLEKAIRTSGPNHPSIRPATEQLNGLRSTILSGIRKQQDGLQITRVDIQRQIELYGGRLEKAPTQQREIIEINREQQVREALYLFLLQKREETSMALAATVPIAKILDPAYTSPTPVSPKPMLIWAIALMLGFVLPIGLFFLQDLFATRIRSLEEIKKILPLPIAGIIPWEKNSPSIVVDATTRSNLGEAFRLVRANLGFIAPQPTHKVLLITSTGPGEGKTFMASNLAVALALSGKKTVLVGLDLRNPQVSGRFSLHPAKGVTHWLTSDLPLEEILTPVPNHPNLTLVSAGAIPPNPSELLMGEKLEELILALKKAYDYVIVDTAPIIIADTYTLNRIADTMIFVAKIGQTHKEALAEVRQAVLEKKLPNACLLVNAINIERKYGYGYGNRHSYGYGYGYKYKNGYGHTYGEKPARKK